MPTGNEQQFYRHIERIARALERIADCAELEALYPGHFALSADERPGTDIHARLTKIKEGR